MRDRHNPRATGKAYGRLDSNHAAGIRRADDAAVGLGAEGERREVGRLRGTRSGARTAGVAIEPIGVVSLATDRRPTADRLEGAEVGPLGQVGLAQNYGAARTQVG